MQKWLCSVSPCPTSDEKAQPCKKTTLVCPPSPPLIVMLSTSPIQCLSGPSRTPAHVEQILSANTDSTRQAAQMVLNTSG
jgi:hypothetical protein